MKRISLTQSPRVILNRHSPFNQAQLGANPDLATELTMAQEEHGRLELAVQDWEAAERETMAALAVRGTRRWNLDVSLRALHGAVLAEVHNNRLADAYRVVFPDGFAAVLRGGAQAELNQARRIAAALPDPQPPGISTALGDLWAAIDSMTAALAGCDAAKVAERAASAVVRNAKARFAAMNDEIYSRLVAKLGNRRLAETYFWHDRPSDNERNRTPDAAQESETAPTVPANTFAGPTVGETTSIPEALNADLKHDEAA